MTADDFSFDRFAQQDFYQRVNEHLVKMVDFSGDRRVLDLACGVGNVTAMIVRQVADQPATTVIGLDYSAEGLELARREVTGSGNASVEFLQGRVEDVADLIHEPVDTIVFCNAIHYVPDKAALLGELSKTLKPGGKLAINTSFFEGGQPPESQKFYRRWMLRALRLLKSKHGMTPDKSEKVESRKHLTPDRYRALFEEAGYTIVTLELEGAEMTAESWCDISRFKDFIEGIMPGVPLDKASDVLREAVHQTYDELGLETLTRNWLNIIAARA